MNPSSPPEARDCPSGLKAIEVTHPLCGKAVVSLPEFRPHIRTNPSVPPEASCLPSGLNATDLTVLLPYRMGTPSWGGSSCHIRIKPFPHPPETRNLPSTLKAIKLIPPALLIASAIQAACPGFARL